MNFIYNTVRKRYNNCAVLIDLDQNDDPDSWLELMTRLWHLFCA
jgi:hypothetical protein